MILFVCTFSFHVYVYDFVLCSHVRVRLRFCLRLRFRLRLRLRVRHRLRFRSRVLFRFEVWRLGESGLQIGRKGEHMKDLHA